MNVFEYSNAFLVTGRPKTQVTHQSKLKKKPRSGSTGLVENPPAVLAAGEHHFLGMFHQRSRDLLRASVGCKTKAIRKGARDRDRKGAGQ